MVGRWREEAAEGIGVPSQAFPLVLAFSFSSTEQQIIGLALLAITAIGALSYIVFEAVHFLRENWIHIDAGGRALVDFWWDRRIQIERRRAELKRVRRQLESGALKLKTDAPLSDTAAQIGSDFH